MSRWYVQNPGSGPVGPVDTEQLRAAWRAGQVAQGTLVCAEGGSDWVPFAQVPDLVAQPVYSATDFRRKQNRAAIIIFTGIAVVALMVGFWWSLRLPSPMVWCENLAKQNIVAHCADANGVLFSSRAARFVLVRDPTSGGAINVYDDKKAWDSVWNSGTVSHDFEEWMEPNHRVYVTLSGKTTKEESDAIRRVIDAPP